MEEIVMGFHPPPADEQELSFYHTRGKPLFLVSRMLKLIFCGHMKKPDVTGTGGHGKLEFPYFTSLLSAVSINVNAV